MTLEEFIERFDRPGSVVLLEGKRTVAEDDRGRLEALGRLLAESTRHILFRSGNASGADHWFSKGVAGVDPMRLQVITPYTGHRQKANFAGETIALDGINLGLEPDLIEQTRRHPATSRLIDPYLDGDRGPLAIKAAYILRDTVKVMGTKDLVPAVFALFYDDLQHPGKGGTGHTMAVCRRCGVPFVDQNVWFNWLEWGDRG